MLADDLDDKQSMVETMGLANSSAAMIDYSAPGTFIDPSAGSPVVDAYLLGCCLYFTLTCQPPFPGERIVDKVFTHHLFYKMNARAQDATIACQCGCNIVRVLNSAEDERPADFTPRFPIRCWR